MSDSGFLTQRQRQDAIRQAKLDQERSYSEKVKLDRMSKNDPRYEQVQTAMIDGAQACGRRYAQWLKAQGRPIKIVENNS